MKNHSFLEQPATLPVFSGNYATKFLITVVFMFFLSFPSITSFGQNTSSKSTAYKILADSLFKNNEYKAAARVYMKEYNNQTMVPLRKQALVNAAYGYAVVNMQDSALLLLDLASTKYGFVNKQFLQKDSVFLMLKSNKKYDKLISYLDHRNIILGDPAKAIINTSDIDLFWKVYDQFLLGHGNAQEMFLAQYFDKGSAALQDYYLAKTKNIGGIKGFVHNMNSMQKFYADIRYNTNHVQFLKDSLKTVYHNLKAIYPDAIYPPLTFVIGGWSSGGTITDYGLIVGADMYANNATTDKSELNAWQKRNCYLFETLKNVVAHELVHAQQGNLKSDTILLKYAIEEGMADFIGELISGNTANPTLHKLVKGKEKKVWEEFKKEMYLDRYSNWIANSSQEREDWPADLGYWVGYQICKAYYEEASNKKQAIHEMLNIKDYKRFLEKSRFDEKVNKLF